MKKKIKPKLKKFIVIVLLLFIAVSLIGAIVTGINLHNAQTVPTTVVAVTEEFKPEEVAIEETITEQFIETYTTMYSKTGLNIRFEPNTTSKILDTVTINTELQTVDNSENDGWIKIKLDNGYYYVASEYLSKEKVVIKPKVTYQQKSGSGVLTKSKGVNYFNGHKETWYSQRVLPGGGLNIPGRHVASDGTIRDENDYICVASSDYPKGTIVETSLGTGKVYDCGCASGIIDIYTDW